MDQKEEQAILCENLRIFSERDALSQKQRELALSLWIRRLLEEKESDPSVLYERFRTSLLKNGGIRVEDQAAFCATMAKLPVFQKRLLSHTILQKAEPAASGSHGRIALVRNHYNEEAFSHFESSILGAKAEFFSSFSDACEEVFDNLCEFCILPIGNTADGRLFGFYSMLDRYELKICAACELESDTSPDAIRYALIGKHLPRRIPQNAEWNFEFYLSAETEDFPYDIFRVAPIFEATPVKIDSLPILYDDKTNRIYLTFRLPKAMAYAFDLYLSQEHPRYTAIGLYPILN